MAQGQIDSARLESEALRRWYLRPPADIEKERQAAALQRHHDFFSPARQPVQTGAWEGARPQVAVADGASEVL